MNTRVSLQARLAFTLLEMLVVMMIMAIIAGIAVPRLLGNDVRVYQLTCDQVSDLLTMFAKRESTSSKPLGLMYDEQRRWLMVMEYDFQAETASASAQWRNDLLMQPVRLPPFVKILDVRSNGDFANIAEWPLTTRPGQQRPTITIALDGPGGATTFVLPPYAVAPRQIGGVNSKQQEYLPEPVDLNATGRSRGEW